MRVRTRSACVVLAWGILLILVAVGSIGSSRPAQANTRIASNTSSTAQVTLTSTLTSTVSGRLDATKAPATARTDTETAGVADAQTSVGRYVVQPGDSLSGIAAGFGVRGGWPALGAAKPAPKATAPEGLPRWLDVVLVAAGLLIAAAFLAEAILAIVRRRRRPAGPSGSPADKPARDPGQESAAVAPPVAPTAARPARTVTAPDRRILLADYDRLVVTSSGPEGIVCVLRPPNAAPEAILLAARLVLAQDRYEELAGHLGLAPHWRRE
jgi:hypothetical protein